MTVKQQAEIFGLIVATIGTVGIVWGMRHLADIWPMSAWLAFVGVTAVCLLLLAWLMDTKASVRAKHGQSDQS